MNRKIGTVLLCALVASCMVSAAMANPTAKFEEGMKAAAAKDYATALTHLEAALSADPNNLQFGSEYRQTVIAAGEYDRALAFFEQLVTANPKASNAFLNYGFTYVDKIPVAGAITQVILANSALEKFTAAITEGENWLTLYTRGNSYLFWPAIFNRAQLGVDDLEKSLALTKNGAPRAYYVRSYVALGDGYWRLANLDKAREIWQAGLKLYPDNADLKTRLSLQGADLDAFYEQHFSATQRVDTNLREMWEEKP